MASLTVPASTNGPRDGESTVQPSVASSITDVSLDKEVEPALDKAEEADDGDKAERVATTKEIEHDGEKVQPVVTQTEVTRDNEKVERTDTRNTLASLRDQLPTNFRLFAIILALVLSMFLVSLDMTIVATAIPRITDEFHSLQDVGWYGSAFFLTLASFQSTWGKAYRYFDLKLTFLMSIFIFEVGSLICGVSQNSVTLIVGRAIAGLGGAGVASGVYIIIAFSAPPDKRAAYTGILGATYGVASVVGPLLGGVFTDHATWRWAFYVNLPIGGAAAAVIFFTFEAPPAARPVEATWKEKLLQMDLPGTFTIMAAVVSFLLAIQWGGVTKPWNDKDVIGTLVGFMALLILFIVIQYVSGDRAVIQGSLLKNRTILVVSIFTFFFAGAFFMLLYYLPIYFQSVDGVSAADSGVRNLPLVLGASIFSIISGGLISYTEHFVPILILGSALTTVSAGLLYTLDVGSTAGQWVGYQLLAGIGIGLALQVPVIAAQSIVAIKDIATVSAMILFFQTIGGAFFVQAGQTAFTNTLIKSISEKAPGIDPTLVIMTGASELSKAFQGKDLAVVIASYMEGLRVTYALAIALAGIGTIVAFFSEWRNLKGKTPVGSAV